MSRYRDDLSAAHERIEKLEDELALSRSGTNLEKPVEVSGTRKASHLLVLAAMGVTAGVVIGLYEYEHHHHDDHHLADPHAEVPAIPSQVERLRLVPRLQAAWGGAQDDVPTVVDVDGDGTKDLVGLFSRHGKDGAEARWAIAIDGRTFEPRWTAGPFAADPAEVRLAVSGRSVFVANDGMRLRTLALATGKTTSEETLDGVIAELCPTDGGRILLRRSTGARSGILSAATYGDDLVLRPAPNARCPDRPRHCGPTNGSSCVHGADGPLPPKTVTTGFRPWRTFEEHDSFVAVGSLDSERWRGETRAVGWSRGASVPTWEGSIRFSIDRLHDGHVRHTLADGRLVSLYETEEGLWRVIAHDLKDGSELWYGIIPHATEWSHVTAFAAEGPYVFVATDGTLLVLDSATGRVLKSLDPTTL